MTTTLEEFGWNTLDGMIGEQAKLLDASLRDQYEHGFEYRLARELIAGLNAGQRTEALRFLARDKMAGDIAMSGVLNECAQGSYDTADGIASMLLAEIAAQDREAAALEHLVAGEICAQQRLIAFTRTEADVSR